ncbi:MAG: hypothetical protein ABSG04_17045 [Verrucomicrobiota bacterium]|jgi:hypothetical protein
MTNAKFAILIATIVLCTVLIAIGQSYGALSYGVIAPALANCPAGQANMTTFCTVGTAAPYTIYVSFNAGAYQLLVPAASGVASFNGRTGAVTLTDADVTGTGLKVSTTVTSTAVSTPQ